MIADFTGRVAIITGAARGLGRAVAERLYERGASVSVNVRDDGRALELARSLGDRAHAVSGDLAAEGVPEAIVQRTLQRFGRVDILVNNAALALTTRFPDLTAQEWRATLPAQSIAFSSSSSIAALPALVESAEDALGIPNRVTGFVLPLAVSTFKIAAPVSWTVGALFVAWFYGVPLHARELATIASAAVFLGFASPGIPRGAFIMLAPLFTAIRLPVEGIGILIAVDAIPDTFATVLNPTGNLTATVLVSRWS